MFVAGKILLLTSPVNVIVSVAASPSWIFPSAVIVPVACKFPVTKTFEFKLITPDPLAVILTAPLILVDDITFPDRLKLPTSAVPL